jgi:hypothetical protein
VVLRENVQAPPPRPPLYGLLAAAPTIDDPELRFPSGWAFVPEGCGNTGKLAVDLCGNTAAMSTGGDSCPDVVEGEPVWIYAEDRGSSLQGRDWQARAQRQLTATQSFELADELWNGTVTAAATPDLPNRWLSMAAAESDTLTTAATTPTAALGCVTQGLAEYLKGQQGMIHVTPQLLTHLTADSLVIRQGNLWVTAMGHIVVADAGYSGDGPGASAAGATQWMYGTPMISVRLGPIEVIPNSLGEARQLAQALDYTVNTIAVFAGRLAGFQWHNACAHVAAEVNLPICAIGGAG